MANLFRVLSRHRVILPLPPSRLVHPSMQLVHSFSNDNSVVFSILDSLHKGLNWKTLTQKFSSVEFTNEMAQEVLLQLKEPANSRKALNFFHWSAKDMHLQHGISSYCMTIHILVKGRFIKDTKALFETVLIRPSPDDKSQMFAVLDSLLSSYGVVDSIPFAFDLFIRSCAKLRMVDNVLDACKLLFDHGFPLSVASFNTLLHVMQKSENTHLVWGVYQHMIETRVYPNEDTIRIMVRALCKEGKMEKFIDIVDRMHGKRCAIPGLIVNTCLVYDMIEDARAEDGLKLLKRMLQKNMILDTVSYSLVVFAKVRMGNLEAAQVIYDEMLKRGFNENAFVCSLFIGAYCGKGRINEAIGLLEEMKTLGFKPPADTFNVLLMGCSANERLGDSLTFFKHMISTRLIPSSLAVNGMFQKLCENGNTKQADEMLTILLDKGFISDENTFSHLIDAYGREGDIEGVTKLLFEMEYRSLSPNVLGFTSSIISFCKCGRLKEADKYLEMMKARLLVPSPKVYKELIAGHLEKGDETRANQLSREMLRTKLKSKD